ncbi:Carboxy-terminal domain (CTD) phosphatase [Perkinsus olseni]|uniref:protein-serine/threonine phosphatase n=1 Tax=Perkinsus olseni TaxID=32597 RepID=A0A7J6MUP3_PEROL|nr:Carboxy-terminal domain (CTD) phosphatase [Perkinsus olseni]
MPFSSVPPPLDPNVYVNSLTGEREVLLYRGEDSAWDLVYVKLRPGVRELLSQSREIADMAIFSAASSPDYVHFVARKLDPDGCLFDGRIYCSQELGIGTSKSAGVLPTGYEKVVIVDDSGCGIWTEVNTDVCCFPTVPPCTFMRDHIADILNGSAVRVLCVSHWSLGIYVPDEDHFLLDDLLPQLAAIVSNLNGAS